MKILEFVIPKRDYSLCLVNPDKQDIHNLYIRYYGYSKNQTSKVSYPPTIMMAEILYGESYAILDEEHDWDTDTIFHYEVLYVTNNGVVLKKFYRNELKNVQTVHSSPLFTTPLWKIEESECDLIDPEDIIRIVFKDIYAKEAPANLSAYRNLINKSELFELFFDDLYTEMGRFYRGDQCYSREKLDFAEMLQANYHVQFVQSEGSDIILSNCSGLMRKLKLSKHQMAEYFIKYLN
nr:hypothetical protein [Lysinibacillus timonensis]